MESPVTLRVSETGDAGVVAHANLGGFRYLPLGPAAALRNAIREYTGVEMPCETLDYLAEHPSVVLPRADWEEALRAARVAAMDNRLSPEARGVFLHLRDVLHRAMPWPRPSGTSPN
jgi:hypothetical protein